MIRISKKSQLNLAEILEKASHILEKAVRDWTRRSAVPSVFHFQGSGDMSP